MCHTSRSAKKWAQLVGFPTFIPPYGHNILNPYERAAGQLVFGFMVIPLCKSAKDYWTLTINEIESYLLKNPLFHYSRI